MSASAASGAMLAALFPKFGAWFLAWGALVPLLLVARSVGPRSAALYGLLAGCIFFAVLLEWIRIFDTTGWVVLTLWQAAYVAAFALLVRVLAPSPGGWRGLLVPALIWTALEWVRSLTRGGFTWGDLAYAFHGQLALVQSVSLFGPFGLSLLAALANAALASLTGAALAGKEGRPGEARAAGARLGAVAAAALLVWGWGARRLASPPPTPQFRGAGGASVRVAVVQGNIGGEGDRSGWTLGQILYAAETYLRLTNQAADAGARLVVWPESALPVAILADPDAQRLRDAISETARRRQIDILVGTSHPAGERDRYNSAVLFGSDGAVRGRYDKVHLVPFGEYTPWRQSLAFIYRYFPIIPDDCRPGAGFFPLASDAGPLGTAICFESAFPRIARALRRSGAEILAVITNDAWFGRHAATWQHYDMSAFRAVETGSYVLRAATTGFSAVIDPHGRALRQSTLFTRDLLVADVQRTRGATLYLRLGDVAGWGSTLILLGLLAGVWRRRAPHPRPAAQQA